MDSASQLRARVEAAFPRLTKQLRRGARFILDMPDDVAFYPIRRVAKAAGVSASTMSRLATELGYENYEALREELRRDVRRDASRYAGQAGEVRQKGAEQDRGDSILDEVRRRFERGVADTLSRLDVAEVRAIADRLVAARTVYLVGLRSCYAPAFFFAYVLQTFRPRVQLVEARRGMRIDELGDAGPGDLLIAISFAPYTRETVEALAQAKSQGADTACITDSAVSPIALEAGSAVLVPMFSTSFYDSMMPTMAAVEAIIAFAISQVDEAAVQEIDRRFTMLERLGAYWGERPPRR